MHCVALHCIGAVPATMVGHRADRGSAHPPRQGQKRHRPLSNMAMLMLLRRMGVEGVTVHGFRSTFRDWAAEVANAPREVAEMSLSHRIGSQVEQAYARSDLLEKRRTLMERWSDFVTATDAKVVLMKKNPAD